MALLDGPGVRVHEELPPVYHILCQQQAQALTLSPDSSKIFSSPNPGDRTAVLAAHGSQPTLIALLPWW